MLVIAQAIGLLSVCSLLSGPFAYVAAVERGGSFGGGVVAQGLAVDI